MERLGGLGPRHARDRIDADPERSAAQKITAADARTIIDAEMKLMALEDPQRFNPTARDHGTGDITVQVINFAGASQPAPPTLEHKVAPTLERMRTLALERTP